MNFGICVRIIVVLWCSEERNDVTCYYELAVEKLLRWKIILYSCYMKHKNVTGTSLTEDVNPSDYIVIHVRK